MFLNWFLSIVSSLLKVQMDDLLAFIEHLLNFLFLYIIIYQFFIIIIKNLSNNKRIAAATAAIADGAYLRHL